MRCSHMSFFIALVALATALLIPDIALAQMAGDMQAAVSATLSHQLAQGTIHPLGFPAPVGPVAEQITWLYNIIFIIIAVIAIIVAVPVGWILWRYRRTNVAKPATFSHNLGLELSWTIIPALICFFIAYESYRALINIRTMPDDALNVEAVAYQFGWDFYYPDASENGTHVKAATPNKPDPEVSAAGVDRLVPELVVPVGRPVVVHVTGADVIHAFFVPQLGVKVDAMPGRVNYVWFKADEPGSFLGQCAELCGQAHGEMFFRVKAVPQADFDAYIQAQRVEAGLTAVPVSATAIVSATAVSTTAISDTELPVPGVSATAPTKVSVTNVSATAVIAPTNQ
jgi:cytochrome c oxidase subunit II